MNLAIMQPYWFPYVGYFQLIASAELFVVYDNIKYTKKGWINRNRLLRDGRDFTITVPIRNDSNTLNVHERVLADNFDRSRLLNQVREAYNRAPHFGHVFPLVESCVLSADDNLFGYVYQSIAAVCRFLQMSTRIVRSSSVDVDPALRGVERVIATCRAVGATTYRNPVGGQELYARQEFLAHGIQLEFLKSLPFEYVQFGKPFVPWLSIIDVMMFNSVDEIRRYLAEGYELA